MLGDFPNYFIRPKASNIGVHTIFAVLTDIHPLNSLTEIYKFKIIVVPQTLNDDDNN